MRPPGEVLVGRLRRQAAACHALGSPFYGALLEAAADDLERDGPAREVLDGFENEPGTALVALRLMAAVHRLVLEDALPALAAHYPSTGGDGDIAGAWSRFHEALDSRRDAIRSLLTGAVQTNEVGRSAALLGGFLEVAHRTGKPLRILELGASAGLNLRWDRYRYESSTGAWGDESSPVRFSHSFATAPPMGRAADVVERGGCDLNPIDPSSAEGGLTLRSFVWADQLGRLALLDGAIEVARQYPIEVERIGAADYLERELARPRPDVATVVFHSIFMQYVSRTERQRIEELVARPDVHHLRFEPNQAVFEIRLDGELLGTAQPHGTGVRWNVDSASQ